jgi:hypothetical protein
MEYTLAPLFRDIFSRVGRAAKGIPRPLSLHIDSNPDFTKKEYEPYVPIIVS